MGRKSRTVQLRRAAHERISHGVYYVECGQGQPQQIATRADFAYYAGMHWWYQYRFWIWLALYLAFIVWTYGVDDPDWRND